MEKRCPKCETKKDVSEFYENKTRYDGLSGWCKQCDSEFAAAYSKTPQYKNQPSRRKRWAEKQMKIIKPRGSDY